MRTLIDKIEDTKMRIELKLERMLKKDREAQMIFDNTKNKKNQKQKRPLRQEEKPLVCRAIFFAEHEMSEALTSLSGALKDIDRVHSSNIPGSVHLSTMVRSSRRIFLEVDHILNVCLVDIAEVPQQRRYKSNKLLRAMKKAEADGGLVDFF